MIEIVFVNDNAETWSGSYGVSLVLPVGMSRHLVEAVTNDEVTFVFGPPGSGDAYNVDAPWGAAEDNTVRVVYVRKPEEANVVIFENSFPRE